MSFTRLETRTATGTFTVPARGDMNFAGTVVIHKFTPDEISHRRGFDGTGLPEWLLDLETSRMTA